MLLIIMIAGAFAWCMLPKNDGVYSINDDHRRKVIRRMTYDEGMAELREKHKEP